MRAPAWKGVKKPYTPFTPKVDKKYAFNFEKSVRNNKAMHEHFKLAGTFNGPPTRSFMTSSKRMPNRPR